MAQVVYLNATATSARRIGYPCVRETRDRNAVTVNWGVSMAERFPTQNGADRGFILNPPESVKAVVNKYAALVAMKAAGISVPELIAPGGRIPSNGHQYVVRYAEHSEGSDFSLVEGPVTLTSGQHATRFIPDTREYRVWFTRRLDGTGHSYLTSRRVPRTAEGQHASDPCRSSWGYEARDNFPGAIELVKQAANEFRLNYGAVDMLWSDDDHKWYVLEVNSAPSLDTPRVLDFIKGFIVNEVTRLERILQQTTPRPTPTRPAPVVSAPDPITSEEEPAAAPVRRSRSLPVTTPPGAFEADVHYAPVTEQIVYLVPTNQGLRRIVIPVGAYRG